MSLLEVVLALAILGIALAMIGELIRLGSRAGEAARDDMEKQLIAESLVNEIAASATYPEPVFEQPVDSLGEWLYTVETEAVSELGLIAIRVTIRKPDDASTLPPYSLTRWMMDPEVEANAREAEKLMEEQLRLRNQAQASGSTVDTSSASSSANQSTSPMGTGMPPTTGGQNPMGQPNGLPPGFDPSKLPAGFDPSKLPPGFDPSKFDPSQLPPGLVPGGRGNRGGGNNNGGGGRGGGNNGGGRGGNNNGGNNGPGNGNNGPGNGNNGPGGRGNRGGGSGGGGRGGGS